MLRKKFGFTSYLLALATMILSSCQNKPIGLPSPDPYELRQQIEQDYLIIRDVELKSYLNGLVFKLIQKNSSKISIELASADQAFAHSFPTGLILLSTSLVEICNSESELAFVLAHELGHVILGHHSDAISTLDLGELRKRELAADFFGVKALTRSGYSINAAFTSIQRLSSVWDFYGNQGENGYPSTSERLMQLQAQIIDPACLMTGRCLNGGIDNTREFEKFKRKLTEEAALGAADN